MNTGSLNDAVIIVRLPITQEYAHDLAEEAMPIIARALYDAQITGTLSASLAPAGDQTIGEQIIGPKWTIDYRAPCRGEDQ